MGNISNEYFEGNKLSEISYLIILEEISYAELFCGIFLANIFPEYFWRIFKNCKHILINVKMYFI